MRIFKTCFLSALLCLLLSCVKVGPDYHSPDNRGMPDSWQQKLSHGMQAGEGKLDAWWRVFNDPQLNSLIQRGRANNHDLKTAYSRIMEAGAFQQIARGQRFPDLNLAGSAKRAGISNDFLPATTNAQTVNNFYHTEIQATWEIDFWGRVSRSIEASNAELDASLEDFHDILVLLDANIATSYIEMRTGQARIKFAKGNRGVQRETLKITKARYKAELVSKIDVHQARLNLARTEALIPQLEEALSRSKNRLAVLLGEFPSVVYSEFARTKPIPRPPRNIIVSMPTTLIRQRPDIRRVERSLAAQTARIGVAKADLYPRFDLAGVFGFLGTSSLIRSSNSAWSIGPVFFLNIFDGGRVKGRIKVESARAEQAWHQYQKTLRMAVEEVENSLSGFAQEQQRTRELATSVYSAKESARLKRKLYISGLTNFQDVLDMERDLFEQEDAYAESQGRAATNLVNIYRALGGSWENNKVISKVKNKVVTS